MTNQRVRFVFMIVEILIVAFTLIVFVSTIEDPSAYSTARETGKRMALVSIGTLGLALTPGILQRFQVFRQIMIKLMIHRRHLGILTYILALSHYLLVGVLPNVLIGTIPKLSPYTLAGLFALLLLTPLFVTSNDISVRILGRNWARLQKLVHLSLPLIAIHLLLVQNPWAIPLLILLVIEIMSYINKYRRRLSPGHSES